MSTFNLSINMEFKERKDQYIDNNFVKGEYIIKLTPSIVCKFEDREFIVDSILYQKDIIRNGLETMTMTDYKVIRSNTTNLTLDVVDIEGISKDNFKTSISEFVSTFTDVKCEHEDE